MIINWKRKYKFKCKKDSNSLFSLYIHKRKKLSGGAIAGIVVGIVFAIVILVISITVCKKKKKKNIELSTETVHQCEIYSELLESDSE